MKKTFKFFMMAAIVAAGFTACSSEEVTPIDPNNPETPNQEEATYATFLLNLNETKATTYDPSSSGSAAENDANDGDLSYSDVRLLIFDSQTKALEINEVFTDARKTVLVQAGNKKIFTIANTMGALKTACWDKLDATNFAPGSKTIEDFYAIVYDAGTPQALGAALPTTRSFNFEPLHKHARSTKGLPASNSNAIEYELNPNIERDEAHNGALVDETNATPGKSATNSFKISLTYMIAKARLYLGDTEANLTTNGDAVSNITYTIRNLARKTNFVQNVVAGVARSYYYSDYTINTTASEFLQDFDMASAMQTTAITTTAGNYLYVPENNNQLLRRGQSSHFVIKATFKPGQVITDATYTTSGIKYTTTDLDNSGSLDYVYTVAEVIEGMPAGMYYTDLATLQKAAWLYKNNAEWKNTAAQIAEAEALVDATDEKTAGGELYYQFFNAESWYRLDLGESTTGSNLKPGVLRGKAYNAKINSITGPGVPGEGEVEKDPEQPVVSMTYISATIEVKAWDVVSQVGELK
ncbi:hypothetical protein M2463_003767 [Parabacteroides sp. PH5-13]|uniref:fimbria major subunit n=2 Tax=unclassified Parabacteroides TaxID=2649774 RepID=UPI002473C6E8|nr:MULTISPECIES: fimbria major subunit [unclassified Parabacteroides]MDH6321727.1 hypothetical protein [Parabacteroides sp. PH5-13]MDH6395952.1 hypothetical protein [Parabacteroides sp. PFB2-22]